MSDHSYANVSLEPERYELAAAPPYRFDLDRREFFKFLGAGVLVVSVLKPAIVAQESGGARRGRGDSLPKEIDAWLHVGENGKVTVYTGKVEMGQNIRTSLAQAVAEELHVPMDKIEIVMGDTQLTPFDMGTFGSRTTPTMNLQLRKVAAAAREMLIGMAAAQWQADRQQLIAEDGKITDRTKQSIFGICSAFERAATHSDRHRRDSSDSGCELEGGGSIGAQSGWARLCDGQASVSVRPEIAGHALRQGAAAPFIWRDIAFGGLAKGRADGRHRSARRQLCGRCRLEHRVGCGCSCRHSCRMEV